MHNILKPKTKKNITSDLFSECNLINNILNDHNISIIYDLYRIVNIDISKLEKTKISYMYTKVDKKTDRMFDFDINNNSGVYGSIVIQLIHDNIKINLKNKNWKFLLTKITNKLIKESEIFTHFIFSKNERTYEYENRRFVNLILNASNAIAIASRIGGADFLMANSKIIDKIKDKITNLHYIENNNFHNRILMGKRKNGANTDNSASLCLFEDKYRFHYPIQYINNYIQITYE